MILVAAVFGIGAAVAFQMIMENERKQEAASKKPPVVNPTDIIDKSLIDPLKQGMSAGHSIGDFTFLDQRGIAVDQNIIKNKVFVVDYFFTTCKGICPAMSKQMMRVNEAFKDENDLVILSHTVMPWVDSVSVMKAYAEEHKAVPGKWYFLTGDKAELYRMARQSYFVLKPAEVAGGGDGGSDFIHTDQFVLVDKNRKVRGYYKGTDPDEVDRLMLDVRYILENE